VVAWLVTKDEPEESESDEPMDQKSRSTIQCRKGHAFRVQSPTGSDAQTDLRTKRVCCHGHTHPPKLTERERERGSV
jgi:predicted phosphodiesterase